jgi:farnesol dehydrogenase
MKFFVTGATGYIGIQLCRKLAQNGHTVHALFRSESKTADLENQEGILLFKGDILDADSIARPILGCDGVFHVAAFAKPWDKDSQTFYRYNVEGAKNIFAAARKAGVRKVVFTSTAGVISPSNGVPSDENTPRKVDYFTHYDRSKAEAEATATEFSRNGMSIVTVNPTRVYGPGLLSDSNGVTRMVKLFMKGRFRLLPGDGNSIGNYVYIDDVVNGHVLAMEKGQKGQRYILGGDNISFNEFFNLLSDLTGKNGKMYKVPIPVMSMAAKVMEMRANLTGTPPLMTPPWVKKYTYNWELSSEKAIRELGYQITAIEDGLAKTVDWILRNRRSRK